MVTLLTKDTKRRTSDEVAVVVESVGGTFNEFSGNNTFGLSLEVLPGDVSTAPSTRSARRCSRPSRRPRWKLNARRSSPRSPAGRRRRDRGPETDPAESSRTPARDRFARHRGGTKAVTPRSCRRVAPPAARGGTARRRDRRLRAAHARAETRKAFLRRLPEGAAPAAGPAFAGPQAGVHEEIQPAPAGGGVPGVPCPESRGGAFHFRGGDEVFSGMASNLFERVREQKGLAYFVRRRACWRSTPACSASTPAPRPTRRARCSTRSRRRSAACTGGGITAKAVRRRDPPEGGAAHEPPDQRRAGLQAALNASYGLPINDWKMTTRGSTR